MGEERERAYRDMIRAACKREQEMLNGTAFKNKYKMKLCAFPPVPPPAAEQCLKGDNVRSRDWRSEGKASHNNELHSVTQKLKYGTTYTKTGERKLMLEGCAADLKPRKRLVL